MKKYFFILGLLLGLAIFVTPVKAQENPEAAAKNYNISFPIAELGSCGNFTECKAYCDSETNRDVCTSFAKKKGFYKEVQQPDDNIIREAKSELGCNSESSCRAVCEKEENIDKCSSFAQKHGLDKGNSSPGDARVLQKAKEILGCDSESSCRAICENPDNQDKCSKFAQQAGLGGGIKRVGPGGCSSEESCKAFCEKNMDECRQFGGKGPEGSNQNRTKYCQEHPQTCQDQGSQKSGQDMEKFCRENPDKCSNKRGGEADREEFCKQNPDKCQSFRESSTASCPEPVGGCSEGKSWDRGTCSCKTGCPSGSSWNGRECMRDSGPSGSGGSSAGSCPEQSCSGGMSWDRGTCSCKPSCPSGTSWTGSYCMTDTAPSSGSSSNISPSQPASAPSAGDSGSSSPTDPAIVCANTSGCSWTGSSCQCTRGIATQRNFFQAIWDFLSQTGN